MTILRVRSNKDKTRFWVYKSEGEGSARWLRGELRVEHGKVKIQRVLKELGEMLRFGDTESF
jgi:hypothetical protein